MNDTLKQVMQFFWRSMTTGVLARAALIGSIYKRGVNLNTKARTKFPNAVLVNHVSADVRTYILNRPDFGAYGLTVTGQQSGRLCAVVCECCTQSS